MPDFPKGERSRSSDVRGRVLQKSDETSGDRLRVPLRGFRLTTCAQEDAKKKEYQQDGVFAPERFFEQIQNVLVQRSITWLVADL